MAPIRLPADRVHAWRMERQFLGREKAGTPAEVARRLVGVQAQVTSSAALSIALRSKAPRGKGTPVEATTRALHDRQLVRAWAMRGTLHLFAAEDVALVAAALENRQMWRRPAWLRWFGLTEREMEALIEAIGEILDDGVPRTRAELSVIVGERLGPEAGRHLLGSWGSVLKIASDHHFLVQSAEADAGVRFVRASRWITDWRDVDAVGALPTLIDRYLGAYGPASTLDIQRWWGATILKVMKPAIAELGDRIVEVDVDGSRAFVRRDDLDAIEATRPTRNQVRFLGGFDPLTCAKGARDQMLRPAFLPRVSRTAGWISPVVLQDGRIIAVWDSKVAGSKLAITVDPFDSAEPAVRSSIASAAEQVGAALGLPVDVAFGRVFTAPPRKLRIEPSDA
ncbi:MAG TPA: winged helix DNA-binding domain-containing protein [Candidatus Limnocylindrales bacterium]|nr:winged helix DNA-binding domain-containing protein [Candidatus Limnocylindrales bacterium]